MRHKRTAVASMFQNDIFEIPNVPKGTVFAEKVTYVKVGQSFHFFTRCNSYALVF